MKNKYQEALDKLIQDYNYLIQQSSNLSQYYEWYDTQEKIDKLQELVDKETPMKPNSKIIRKVTYDFCPICEESVHHDYCSGCGQKIDWSDDNEIK